MSTREQRFQAPETQVFENGPQSGAFSESPAYRLCEQTRTGFFEYGDVVDDTAHALFNSNSLFFLCFNVFVWTRIGLCVFFVKTEEKKMSVFKNIRIRVY